MTKGKEEKHIEEHEHGCSNHDTDIYFKANGKKVPSRLYSYYVKHPEEAKRDCVMMCKEHHLEARLLDKISQIDNK